jgi:hypothetical protein
VPIGEEQDLPTCDALADLRRLLLQVADLPGEISKQRLAEGLREVLVQREGLRVREQLEGHQRVLDLEDPGQRCAIRPAARGVNLIPDGTADMPGSARLSGTTRPY